MAKSNRATITIYITDETTTNYYKAIVSQGFITRNPPYHAPNNSLWYQTPQNIEIGQINSMKHRRIITSLTAQQWQAETALPLHKPAWL